MTGKMTLADELAFRVCAPVTPKGIVIVLSGRHETTDQTPARKEQAAALGAHPLLFSAENTAEEADMIAGLALQDVTVVTHQSHAPRALLTLLNALERRGAERRTRVWVVSVLDDWATWTEEQAKIAQYQETGDVASYEAGLEYLAWRG